MIRSLAACLLAAALASPAGAQAVVRGDWIALKDVAPVPGEAGDILLGPAPPPGQTLALDPAFVIAVARKSGVYLALPLEAPIWVKREALRAAPAAPIAASAPVARQALRARDPGQDLLAGAPNRADVLLLVRDLRRGDTVRAEDIEWGPAPAGRTVRNAPRDEALVVGQAVRRNLVAGAAIEVSDLESPDLVRKGEPVTLVYAVPGLRLSVAGLAQGDAGLGDNVRVLNHQSKRSIDATVTGPAEAIVQKR
jgi:flagellar basal body P-ring formation protein FlgA